MSEPESRANKPVEKITIGAVTAAIFADERTRKDGGRFTSYSVSITRTFTRNDGQSFEHTSSIDAGNLANVAKVARMADEWIAEQKQKEAA